MVNNRDTYRWCQSSTQLRILNSKFELLFLDHLLHIEKCHCRWQWWWYSCCTWLRLEWLIPYRTIFCNNGYLIPDLVSIARDRLQPSWPARPWVQIHYCGVTLMVRFCSIDHTLRDVNSPICFGRNSSKWKRTLNFVRFFLQSANQSGYRRRLSICQHGRGDHGGSLPRVLPRTKSLVTSSDGRSLVIVL